MNSKHLTLSNFLVLGLLGLLFTGCSSAQHTRIPASHSAVVIKGVDYKNFPTIIEAGLTNKEKCKETLSERIQDLKDKELIIVASGCEKVTTTIPAKSQRSMLTIRNSNGERTSDHHTPEEVTWSYRAIVVLFKSP